MGYLKAHFPYEYNIHIMNTFDTQINSYWENVQKIYSPLQEKYDNRCYYLFQTKSYVFNPDLMIVGLNPGGNYQGAGKISQDKNAYVEIDAPWFNTLRRVFDYPNNEFLKTILEYCVGTNRYLLNTGNQGGLGNIVKEMVGDKSFANVAGELLDELVEIIKKSIPSFARREELSSVKRVFQAVRIEVNKELDVIAPTIEAAVNMMNKGGRIVIITFHSLEDRIVKQTFASLASGCTCPKDFPVCVCGNKPSLKEVTKKPILPSEEELNINPRARSAKLRVAEKY